MSVASQNTLGALRLVERPGTEPWESEACCALRLHGWLTPTRNKTNRRPQSSHTSVSARALNSRSNLSALFYVRCFGIRPTHFYTKRHSPGLLEFLRLVYIFEFLIMPSEKAVTKASEARRSTKPIMEKRRRARINNSLSELKNLILDALKKDNARHSKLEKADILEMTVKHLQNLQMQQMSPDPALMGKFRAGFAECANEVSRFMSRVEGVDHTVRQRLLNHLANCLTGMNNPTPLPPVHVQVAESESANPRLLQGLQLVPTRLPNGDIAFLLPSNLSVYAPSTVPISPASSTSSVTSPMSTTSSPGPVNVLGSSGILSPASSDRCSPSPVIMHTSVHHQVPTITSVPQSTHCPVIVPPVSFQPKVESKSVWRPF